MKAIFFMVFLLPSLALALVQCPYGLENDPYPGNCGRYIDSNADFICDHSQPEIEFSSGQPTASATPNRGKNYNLILISAIVFPLYFTTFLLSKFRIIKLITHRKIWNVILLFSFLVVGSLGILLVMRISFGLNLNLPFNMLFWHVEAGIVMSMVAIFHILWHLSYFRSLFRHQKKDSD